MTRARTAMADGAKRARGESTSRLVPFGYRLAADGRVIPDPREQEIILTIGKLRSAGHSLQEVADELNRQGSRTRTGSLWRRQYVHQLSFRRPL